MQKATLGVFTAEPGPSVCSPRAKRPVTEHSAVVVHVLDSNILHGVAAAKKTDIGEDDGLRSWISKSGCRDAYANNSIAASYFTISRG